MFFIYNSIQQNNIRWVLDAVEYMWKSIIADVFGCHNICIRICSVVSVWFKKNLILTLTPINNKLYSYVCQFVLPHNDLCLVSNENRFGILYIFVVMPHTGQIFVIYETSSCTLTRRHLGRHFSSLHMYKRLKFWTYMHQRRLCFSVKYQVWLVVLSYDCILAYFIVFSVKIT